MLVDVKKSNLDCLQVDHFFRLHEDHRPCLGYVASRDITSKHKHTVNSLKHAHRMY